LISSFYNNTITLFEDRGFYSRLCH